PAAPTNRAAVCVAVERGSSVTSKQSQALFSGIDQKVRFSYFANENNNLRGDLGKMIARTCAAAWLT
ncbi:hypothetical protein, partial [Planktotalea arctica]|uniref:hypothetical protein n=1 Tax=Planktotalea arctica TaxID=1481893 RepID=UPI00321B63CD